MLMCRAVLAGGGSLFFSRERLRRVAGKKHLQNYIYIFTSAHLHLYSFSHLHIYISAHLHICTPTSSHLTSSHESQPSAEIVRVEGEMQVRLRFCSVRSNPPRRSCVSKARNAGETAFFCMLGKWLIVIGFVVQHAGKVFQFFVNVSCETLVLEAFILTSCECLVEHARFGSLHF